MGVRRVHNEFDGRQLTNASRRCTSRERRRLDPARARGELRLERRAPPTFDVLIEIQTRDRLAIHHDVSDAVEKKTRKLSAAARKAISDAQKKRWAKYRKSAAGAS